MKNQKQNVWVGIEDLTNSEDYQIAKEQEFREVNVMEDLPESGVLDKGSSRRDFLKYLGFSLGAATVAASCDIPVRRAVPYVVKPDAIVPGVATYYASTIVNAGDYCSVLVKTREGRPIKIEPNTLSPISMGGTSARAQASVLGLYDTNRYKQPLKSGMPISWADLDKEVVAGLNSARSIRVVTSTIMSPTAKAALANFQQKYPQAKVVTYDAVSSAALLDANAKNFGQRVVPDYHFDKTDYVVSFNADFLGTWISPVEYSADFAKARKITDHQNPKMARHVQVESVMTLTGSNADHRILVRPSQQGAAIAALYNELAGKFGGSSVSAPKLDSAAQSKIKTVAAELARAAGNSIVVSGTNNVAEQELVNAINVMLGNYGKTITFEHASYQRQGSDRDLAAFANELKGGGVEAVVFWNANPLFDQPESAALKAGLAKAKLSVSLAVNPDETADACTYVAPAHHVLESWGDVEAKRGQYSLIQPTIAPLFQTRQPEESLLTWAGVPLGGDQPYFEFLMAQWKDGFFANSGFSSFQAFWDSILHDGVFNAEVGPLAITEFNFNAGSASAVTKPSSAEFELQLLETVNIGDGRYADNPWLMEMPDPINRCAWGNYLGIPVVFDGKKSFDSVGGFAGMNGLEFKGKADIAGITVNGTTQDCTLVRQFGNHLNTVSLAMGYGRAVSGMAARGIGTDVYPWTTRDANGYVQYFAPSLTVEGKTGQDDEFACVQYHHTMGVKGELASGEEVNVDEVALSTILVDGYQGSLTNRSIIYEGGLSTLPKLEEHISEKRAEAEKLNSKSLYPYEEFKANVYEQGHYWGMHVDLSACTGCGACQVACISENNVPVVGKYEVARHHEMTWLRIDRYFYGDYENPKTVYQPMMCQHCDNAPCENVCPVAATNHSSEGLNQMTYNRCIGTRYCANNCPYKVRRFNWMDYMTADMFPSNEPLVNGEELPYYGDNLTRMVLNPDVTVRSRGVIEKCSFCVQRLQEGKLTAKREGRRLIDADVKVACQTACPTGAITFADQNIEGGTWDKVADNDLNYYVLEEVNTRPSVMYQARVLNTNEELEA